MLPNDSDEPDFWHEELKPLFMELDLALKDSVPKAHLIFSQHIRKPVNKPLLSNAIRYFMLEYLKAAHYDVRDLEEDDSWALKNLSNNGIEIIYKESRIRIRKGAEPPNPLTNAARDFYQQVLFEDADKGRIVINLLVLWNLNKDLSYASEMSLIRPTKGNRKYVKYKWRKAVILDSSVDLDTAIEPDYRHPPELPIDPSQPSDDEKHEIDKTGTDDAD